MKLKNDKFYDPGLKDTGISDREYRKEYTRLYVNYAKRMDALKRNGFSWTQTYKEYRNIPKPSELKTTRGIRNNLKGLKDFFDNPMTSTRKQQQARNLIIEQFNDKGIPLKKSEYKDFMKFLNWMAANFSNIAYSSGMAYEAWKHAKNATSDKRESSVYKTFMAQHQAYVDNL